MLTKRRQSVVGRVLADRSRTSANIRGTTSSRRHRRNTATCGLVLHEYQRCVGQRANLSRVIGLDPSRSVGKLTRDRTVRWNCASSRLAVSYRAIGFIFPRNGPTGRTEFCEPAGYPTRIASRGVSLTSSEPRPVRNSHPVARTAIVVFANGVSQRRRVSRRVGSRQTGLTERALRPHVGAETARRAECSRGRYSTSSSTG